MVEAVQDDAPRGVALTVEHTNAEQGRVFGRSEFGPAQETRDVGPVTIAVPTVLMILRYEVLEVLIVRIIT